MTFTSFICHPDRFFLVLRHDPPILTAFALVLVLSLLFGASVEVSERWIRGGFRGKRSGDTVMNFVAPVAGIYCVTVALASLGTLLLHAIKSQGSFEWIFCALVYGSLPCWLVWISYDFLEMDWLAHRAARFLWFCSTLWTTWLILLGVRADPSLSWWQDALLMLPLLTPFWVSCIVTLRRRPDHLGAYLPWRRWKGHGVTVLYPSRGSMPRISEIARDLDTVLDKVAAALGVAPLGFRITVYLFPDAERLDKAVGRKEGTGSGAGYAHDDAISLAFAEGDSLFASAAHEFTHVLRFQRISNKLVGLLDEGLACYVEGLLYGNRTYEIPPSGSVRSMARYTLFYEWLYVKRPEHDSQVMYAYAYCFARYLIGAYGMEKYIALCRAAPCDEEHKAGEKLAEAVESIYGKPLRDVETDWRVSVARSDADDHTVNAVVRLSRKVTELEKQVRALEQGAAGQTAVDFGAEQPAPEDGGRNGETAELEADGEQSVQWL